MPIPYQPVLQGFWKRAASTKPDYIVVGAGSAGCVVAHRLAEAGHTVSLLEAGKSDRAHIDSWKIHMPSALAFNIGDDRYNWNFDTVRQGKNLNYRALDQPRGKVLGGSGSLNAMAYVRGHALDYERWAKQLGTDFWKYENCLPYFRRCQSHVLEVNKKDVAGAGGGSSSSSSAYRGHDGPLRVSQKWTRQSTLLNDAFVKAGAETGYGRTEDQNGFRQEGFGRMDMTVDYETGERMSCMNAYLQSHRYPEVCAKVEVVTDKLVHKLVFDQEGAGASSSLAASSGDVTARGLEVYDEKTGQTETLTANREIVLCAGSVGSTEILQRSGVGDADFLKTLDIASVVHNPHVGQHLEDHLEFYVQYTASKPVSLYPYAATYDFSKYAFRSPITAALTGAEWVLSGTGLACSNQFEVGGFIRTRADESVPHPDVQFHFIPGIVVGQSDFLAEHGYQAHVGTMRPTSRGTVKISSKDARTKPVIDPQYLTTEEDVADQRAAFRLAVEIMEAKAFDEFRDKPYNFQMQEMQDDESVDNWIRDNSHSGYHLSCTHQMGKVVHPETAEVLGVKNLR